MILYLDTSALVKLYVDEEGSEAVREACARAHIIPTSRLAHVETRAAFARAYHEKWIRKERYQTMLEDFYQDWESYFVLEITEDLVRQAGDLAERHQLRALDAIHLASALLVRDQTQREAQFFCFDHKLRRAAKKEGFVL